MNVEFDPIRVQVLGKEEIPSLHETIAIIRGERRMKNSYMMEPQPADGSALVTKAANLRAVKSNQLQLNAYSRGVGGQGHAHLTSAQSGGEREFSQKRSEFNREELEKLRYFLGTLEKPTGNAGPCSLALSGNS